MEKLNQLLKYKIVYILLLLLCLLSCGCIDEVNEYLKENSSLYIEPELKAESMLARDLIFYKNGTFTVQLNGSELYENGLGLYTLKGIYTDSDIGLYDLYITMYTQDLLIQENVYIGTIYMTNNNKQLYFKENQYNGYRDINIIDVDNYEYQFYSYHIYDDYIYEVYSQGRNTTRYIIHGEKQIFLKEIYNIEG